MYYYSKATPEQKEKELTAVSTLVVKAEIHSGDCIIEGTVEGMERLMADEITAAKTAEADTREAIETLDDIQVLESENVDSQTADARGEKQSNQTRKKKPRWSLRINLQCKAQDEQTGNLF